MDKDVEELYNKVVPKEVREAFEIVRKLDRDKLKEYKQRPEVKAKIRKYNHKYNQKGTVGKNQESINIR